MTHKIFKSALAPQSVSYEDAVAAFTGLVEKYIAEMTDWRDHHVILAEQSSSPRLEKPLWGDFSAHGDPAKAFTDANAAYEEDFKTRHDPYKKPTAPADVAAAVIEKVEDGKALYVADFEVVNDDPTPEQILEGKKQALLTAVMQAEQAAQAALSLPTGKQRLANLREQDIQVADLKRRHDITLSGKVTTDDEVEAALRSARPPADTVHLEQQAARRTKLDEMMRFYAKVMADIEDLTVDTVDGFVVPSFEVKAES